MASILLFLVVENQRFIAIPLIEVVKRLPLLEVELVQGMYSIGLLICSQMTVLLLLRTVITVQSIYIIVFPICSKRIYNTKKGKRRSTCSYS